MNICNITELETKLKQCKNISINDANIEDIDKISEIKINKRKKGFDRIVDFICKVSNPYMFNIDDKIVKIEFTDNNKNAEECITNVMNKIYE